MPTDLPNLTITWKSFRSMSVGLYLHRLRDKNLHVRHIVQIFLRKNSIKTGEFIHAGGIWAIVFC